MIFCAVYQLVLKFSHSTPWHQAISCLCFPGRQCCKLQRQAGVSHTPVISSSSDGQRVSLCPGSITAGIPKTPPLRNPHHLLGLAVGPGAIPQGRNRSLPSLGEHNTSQQIKGQFPGADFSISPAPESSLSINPVCPIPAGSLRYFRVVRQGHTLPMAGPADKSGCAGAPSPTDFIALSDPGRELSRCSPCSHLSVVLPEQSEFFPCQDQHQPAENPSSPSPWTGV